MIQANKQSVSSSVSESASQSINQSVSQPASRSVGRSVGQSVGQSVGRPAGRPAVGWSVSQSVSQEVKKSLVHDFVRINSRLFSTMVQTALSHLIVHAILSPRVAHAWPPSLMQASTQTVAGVLVAIRVGNVLNHPMTAIKYIRVVERDNPYLQIQTTVLVTTVKLQLAWLVLVSTVNVYGLHSSRWTLRFPCSITTSLTGTNGTVGEI